MKIRQLGSSFEATECRQHLTTFLVNDRIAIDAGCLGFLAPVESQRLVKHVLISHSHIDHIASLPLFLDNSYHPGGDCPTVFANQDVLHSLSDDVFNERLWPNLSRISTQANRFFDKREIISEVPIQLSELKITPVAVNHAVPTLGFLIEDQHSSIAISSDTGPTERLWELAGETSFRKKLKAVFLECSFPNDHEWLAHESKHLCTSMFAVEIAKLAGGPPFLTVAVHLKAMMHERVCRELEALNLPNLHIGGHDQTWEF